MHLVEAAERPSYRLQATGAPFEAKDLLKARNYRWDGNLRVWFTQLKDELALLAETNGSRPRSTRAGPRACKSSNRAPASATQAGLGGWTSGRCEVIECRAIEAAQRASQSLSASALSPRMGASPQPRPAPVHVHPSHQAHPQQA